MYRSIINFIKLFSNIPFMLFALIIFTIEIIKVYKRGELYDNLEDNKRMVDELVRHIYIDTENYKIHINWLTWIVIAFCYLK